MSCDYNTFVSLLVGVNTIWIISFVSKTDPKMSSNNVNQNNSYLNSHYLSEEFQPIDRISSTTSSPYYPPYNTSMSSFGNRPDPISISSIMATELEDQSSGIFVTNFTIICRNSQLINKWWQLRHNCHFQRRLLWEFLIKG